MPLTKKRRTPGQQVVRKKLADGSIREYCYPRSRSAHASRNAPGSIGALVEAYKRSPEWNALGPRTANEKRRYLRPIEDLGSAPVTSLRRRHILEIRDTIAAVRGHGAANNFSRATSALLAWAVDREWIEHNPAHRIKEVAGGHLRAWTGDEYASILPRLPEHLRRVVVLARNTGQRRGDLIRMTWAQYDGRTVRLVQGKTGAALVIPATDILRAELDEWRRGASSVQILTSEKGRPWLPEHLSNILGRALASLGYAGLNIHGLRKLAAASLAEAGCSANEIAAVTGHASLAMVQLYTRSAEQERLAGAAITRLETGRR